MKWDDFLPHVLPYVKAAPEQLVLDHVIKAARDFCTFTRAWHFETPAMLTVQGTDTYPLALDDDQERVRLMAAWLGDCEIDVVNSQHGRVMRRSRKSARFAYLDGPQDVRLNPAPDRDGVEFVLDIAVRPTLTAAEWPDDLAEHVQNIAAGAIGTLAMLPGQPFSNRQVATDYLSQFAARNSSVLVSVSQGYASSRRSHGMWGRNL